MFDNSESTTDACPLAESIALCRVIRAHGLPATIRADHPHHTVEALFIACTGRAVYQEHAPVDRLAL
jgi:hypothetical protein